MFCENHLPNFQKSISAIRIVWDQKSIFFDVENLALWFWINIDFCCFVCQNEYFSTSGRNVASKNIRPSKNKKASKTTRRRPQKSKGRLQKKQEKASKQKSKASKKTKEGLKQNKQPTAVRWMTLFGNVLPYARFTVRSMAQVWLPWAWFPEWLLL